MHPLYGEAIKNRELKTTQFCHPLLHNISYSTDSGYAKFSKNLLIVAVLVTYR